MLTDRNIRIIKSLIELHADVNHRAPNGESAVVGAITNEHVSTVRLLLDNGADADTQTMNAWTESNTGCGETPLIRGVLYGHIEIVSLLLEAGAEVNMKNRNAMTALYVGVCSNGGDIHKARDIVDLLLAKGADMHARIGNGDTPAHRAVRTDSYSIESIKRELDKQREPLALPEPVSLPKEHRDARLDLLKQSDTLDLEIFPILLEVEDDDDGPDYEFGRYMARVGFDDIHRNVDLVRNAM